MKFLCDRCKTRYSIGDDRVRGKILKIRCKNCANVITVREGMTDSDADADAGRKRSNTTAAPPIAHSMPVAGNGASKPPAALEEEWYVSIDGDQAGPFSLAEAQRWVASKPFEADLHCWSEGFDDWLPVDKVSHFRGLRKKPSPPPPVPRPVPRIGGKEPGVTEEEPRPLFAATMAAIEKGSGPTRMPAGAATPAPVPLKTNGAAHAPSLPATAKGTDSSPALGKNAKSGSGPVPSLVPAAKSGGARAATVQGVGANASAGAKALAAAFDVPDEDPADSMTAIEPAPFPDDLAPPPARPAFGARPAPEPARPAPRDVKPIEEPEDLEIGEVSRVVNLADITRGVSSQRKTSRAPMLRASGSAPKMAAAEVAQPGAFPPAIAPNLGSEPIPSESVVAQAPVTEQRRGMIVLLAVAGVLLAGVLAAVVLIVTSNNGDDVPGSLGHTQAIDTTRPEDIVRSIAIQAAGSAQQPRPVIRHWTGPQIRTNPTPGPDETTDPTKRELDASEVEDMASRQGDGTSFCYKRAQHGALGIEIQDLKRMQVTLTVDKDGNVDAVQLSSHATDMLGLCLAARIRGWKFRQSSGTKTFKITLVFQHG